MILAQDLRDAVLQAAIQGKLTQQLASDSSVDELLEQIHRQKETLIETGQIKKQKKIKFDFDESILFDIPDVWAWCKLDEIITVLGDGLHGTPKFDSNGEYFFVNGNNLLNKCIVIKDDTKRVNEAEYEKYKKELNKNTMFISINGTLGNIAFYHGEKIVLGKSACYFNLFDGISKEYLYFFFRTHYFRQYIKENATGTTIRNVSLDVMRSTHIPIPPIEEQQRIVERVSELMAKIDEFEKIEKQLSAIKSVFPQDMKDALLQAAMQGKLTEQLPSDSSVDDLLETIRKEKEQLIKEKKIKKEKPLKPISEDEIPFDIPDSWRWVRLRDIVYNREQKKPSDKFSYIDIGSIDNVHQKLSNDDNIVEAKNAPSRARKTVKFGDIIYATVRPYLHNTCIIDRKFQYEPIASTGFAVLTCHTGIVNKYLLLYLLSPQFDKYANDTDNAKGIAYPAINDQKLYQAVIPLPPIEEQRRIVQTLEKMLAACEGL